MLCGGPFESLESLKAHLFHCIVTSLNQLWVTVWLVLPVDQRVRPLVMFVKHWAKFQNINDASQGTISSYSLVLMVIHYLQCKITFVQFCCFFCCQSLVANMPGTICIHLSVLHHHFFLVSLLAQLAELFIKTDKMSSVDLWTSF